MDSFKKLGASLCIIKTKKGRKYGAYTDVDWDEEKDYQHGKIGNGRSFVFYIEKEKVIRLDHINFWSKDHVEYDKFVEVNWWAYDTEKNGYLSSD